MRVAIKPPEYFPRLSYYALMRTVDVFVVGDTFQYSRQSFQNRTRIRTPQGWHWISIPLIGRQHGKPINETQIDNRTYWRSQHLRSFQFNYSQTPYYAYLELAIINLLDQDREMLGDLTCQSVSLLYKLLQLNGQLVLASELPGSPGSLEEVLEELQHAHGEVTLYTNHRYEVDRAGPDLDVNLFKYQESTYRQHFEGFERQMSAVDLICNYGPESTSVLASGRG